jgi:DNA repair photolyase
MLHAMPPPPTRNPENRFAEMQLEWDGEAPPAELTPIEERAKSILAENDSPDVGFRWSINPYRGCYHGCAYCYARPSHQYLGYGAGSDFERKIVVKVNAPELLALAFDRRSWKGETIAFSGNTDCYQPLEASYRLTRRLLEVCLDYRNPVSVITKGAVIRRDVELLAALARDARCRVTMSIAFADDDTSRAIEPWASPPSKRFETLRVLADAGIECGVSLAPLIPGLNDADAPEILERAKDAGATHAFTVLLRLPDEVLPVFDERLRAAFPNRHAKVMNAVREMRGGRMYESEFHRRQVGRGERYRVLEQLFEKQLARLGMNEISMTVPDAPSTFRRPERQRSLF